MTRFIKTFFLLAVLIAGPLLGLKYFVEYRVQKSLDEAIFNISILTEVSYESVTVDFMGSRVSVSDLVIDPSDDQIGTSRINELSISVSDRVLFFKYALGMETQAVPESAVIEVQGLALPLSSPAIVAMIDQLNDSFAQVVEPDCGDIQFLQLSDLKAAGFHNPKMDFSLSYQLKPLLKELSFTMLFKARGMADTELEMVVGNIPGLSAKALVSVGKPQISRLNLSYKNRGYVEGITDYCAQQSGLSKDEYIGRLIARENQYYAMTWGMIPGAGLRLAYRDFLRAPDTITLHMSPREDFDFNHLTLYQTGDWQALLRMNLEVNGAQVSPIKFTLPTSDQTLLSHVIVTPEEAVPTEVVAESEEPQQEEERELHQVFRQVAIADLGEHIGARIRILDVRGKRKEGVLVAFKPSEIKLTRRVLSGEMTEPVKVEKIASAEILFVE